VWSTSPGLAAKLTKADPAILTRMINAAFLLPEPSVRYLHGRLLEHSSLTPEDLRAEVTFREQAHAIAPQSALASANAHPDDASVGIPDMAPMGSPHSPRTSSQGPSRRSRCASGMPRRISAAERRSSETRRTSCIRSRGRGSTWGLQTPLHSRAASGRPSTWRRYRCVYRRFAKGPSN
jgi:hypothetical protein